MGSSSRLRRPRLSRGARQLITRSSLLEAAADVFAEHGFVGASVDDIAETAGFSKGAVYSNFRNKEDLFLALVDERLASFVDQSAQVLAGPGGSIAAKIGAIGELHERFTCDRSWSLLYLEFYAYGTRHPEAGRRIVERERRAFERITSLVDQELIAQGLASPVPTRDLTAILMAISEGLWLKKSLDPDAVPKGLFSTALNLLLSTLGPVESGGSEEHDHPVGSNARAGSGGRPTPA